MRCLGARVKLSGVNNVFTYNDDFLVFLECCGDRFDGCFSEAVLLWKGVYFHLTLPNIFQIIDH